MLTTLELVLDFCVFSDLSQIYKRGDVAIL